MDEHVAKAFVRKWPDAPNPHGGKGITMVLMLVSGDVKALADESVHAVRMSDAVDSEGGMCLLSIEGRRPAPEFIGCDASGIIRQL